MIKGVNLPPPPPLSEYGVSGKVRQTEIYDAKVCLTIKRALVKLGARSEACAAVCV